MSVCAATPLIHIKSFFFVQPFSYSIFMTRFLLFFLFNLICGFWQLIENINNPSKNVVESKNFFLFYFVIRNLLIFLKVLVNFIFFWCICNFLFWFTVNLEKKYWKNQFWWNFWWSEREQKKIWVTTKKLRINANWNVNFWCKKRRKKKVQDVGRWKNERKMGKQWHSRNRLDEKNF